LALAQKADELWKGIEWNWYTKGENALYWHWSPNYDFQINMKLQGFDETLITYVLAAASPIILLINLFIKMAGQGMVPSKLRVHSLEFL
jgi:hypothetical protein